MGGISRNETKVIIATLLLVIYALSLSIVGPVMSPRPNNKKFSNKGSVRVQGAVGIGVYWNQESINQVSYIDWGTVDPDSNKTVTVYVKNEGKKPVSLGLYVSNWNPADASDYMSLNWDYGDQFIGVEEIIQVAFTLSISASIEGIETFSFDITITASP